MFDIDKLWYKLCDAMLGIIDALNRVFFWFAGVLPTYSEDLSEVDANLVLSNGDNMLSTIFDMDGIGKLFIILAALGIACLGIALAIGLIKTSFGKEQAESKGKLLGKSLSSFFYIIAMPFIFFVVIICVNAVINLVVYACVGSLGSGTLSLGEIIGNACVKNGKGGYKIGKDWGWFKEKIDEENFNYFMCILSSGCVIVGLFLSILTVVERLIHIVFLYLVSPFVLAKTPLDDGKSFTQWVEMCFTKFLSVAGVIVCMYLFFMIMPTVTGSLPSTTTGSVARCCFIVAGAFTFTKAGTLFAHLISSGAGQFEGMSMGQSTGMLGMGARLGLGAAGKTLMGARMGAMSVGSKTTAGATGLANGLAARGMSTAGATGFAAQNANGVAAASPMTAAMVASRANGGVGGGAGMAFMYGGVAGGVGAVFGMGAKKAVGGLSRAVKTGAHAVGEIKSPKTGLSFNEERALGKVRREGAHNTKALNKQAANAEKTQALQYKRAMAAADILGKNKDFNIENVSDRGMAKLEGVANKYARPSLGDMAGEKASGGGEKKSDIPETPDSHIYTLPTENKD